MKVLYDKRYDIADIVLSDDLSEVTSEIVREDVILDFSGEVLVRIEVQRASKHLLPGLLKTAQAYESTISP